MILKPRLVGLLGAVVLVCAACSTMGGGQLESTVYSIHQTVTKLDKNLGSSVSNLNETTADLTARVDASDRQTLRLQGLVEESQTKLDKLQASVDELRETLYRNLNLVPPSEGAKSGAAAAPNEEVEVRTVKVVPPRAESSEPGPDAMEALTTSSAPPATPAPAATEPVQPSNALTEYQTAYASLQKEDYAGALKQFDAFLQRYPDNELAGRAQFRKAQCYSKLGQNEQAVAEFDKFRKDFPTHRYVPTALRNEAIVCTKLNQMAQAKKLFKELLERYPSDPAAVGVKEKLQELEGR